MGNLHDHNKYGKRLVFYLRVFLLDTSPGVSTMSFFTLRQNPLDSSGFGQYHEPIVCTCTSVCVVFVQHPKGRIIILTRDREKGRSDFYNERMRGGTTRRFLQTEIRPSNFKCKRILIFFLLGSLIRNCLIFNYLITSPSYRLKLKRNPSPFSDFPFLSIKSLLYRNKSRNVR